MTRFFPAGVALSCLLGLLLTPALARPQTAEVAATCVIEGEDLVGTARATDGRVQEQLMAETRRVWSGGAQLLWTPARKGARLFLSIEAGTRTTCTLYGLFTRGPACGSFQLLVNGRREGSPLRGYARRSAPTGRVLVSRSVTLRRGLNTIEFRITGRHQRSLGFHVGVDALELVPVAGPAIFPFPQRSGAAPRRCPPRPARPGTPRRPRPPGTPGGSAAPSGPATPGVRRLSGRPRAAVAPRPGTLR